MKEKSEMENKRLVRHKISDHNCMCCSISQLIAVYFFYCTCKRRHKQFFYFSANSFLSLLVRSASEFLKGSDSNPTAQGKDNFVNRSYFLSITKTVILPFILSSQPRFLSMSCVSFLPVKNLQNCPYN